LAKVLKFCHTRDIEFDARITLADIIDGVLDIYNTNERWVMKKMRLE
jgi:hypothetical protein